jgi:hypothetical protein
MLEVPAPRGMAGVDLSSLFRNAAPPERPFAYGGWSNHPLRSHGEVVAELADRGAKYRGSLPVYAG